MDLEKISDWIDSCEHPGAPFWKQALFGALSMFLLFGVAYALLFFLAIFGC